MNSTPLSNQKNDLTQVLHGIGMTDNQAIVYLSVLELGASSIWDIAQHSGLKRTTCYSLLDELIEKGYASSSNDGKRALYTVTSPKRLLLGAETRVNRFAKALNEIEALASTSLEKPAIRFYSGIEGVREVYLSCLDIPKGQEVCVMSNAILTKETHPDVMNEYISTRISKKIRLKGIFTDSEENRAMLPDNAEILRDLRYLHPTELTIVIETQISGDKVAYISHSRKNPFAMVIENPLFAEQERQRFNLLWEIAHL